MNTKPSINLQKQFDSVTGTLNIFDMSFLVSGTAMLGACCYAFPRMKGFVFHSSHIFLSTLYCLLIAYTLGLVCRNIGKKTSEHIISFNTKKSYKTRVNDYFHKQFTLLPFNKQTLVKLVESNHEDMAYSYMWMKLDSSRDPRCRARFLYVSRIWVLRAIYEGLIPPTLLLSATICYKSWGDTAGLIDAPLIRLFDGHVHCAVIPIVLLLTIFVIVTLAKSADYCNKSLAREIIIAYYDFIEEKEQSDCYAEASATGHSPNSYRTEDNQ